MPICNVTLKKNVAVKITTRLGKGQKRPVLIQTERKNPSYLKLEIPTLSLKGHNMPRCKMRFCPHACIGLCLRVRQLNSQFWKHTNFRWAADVVILKQWKLLSGSCCSAVCSKLMTFCYLVCHWNTLNDVNLLYLYNRHELSIATKILIL